MECAEHLIQEVCFTLAGARQTLLAHYTYAASTGAVPSTLVRTVFTNAAGVPVNTSGGTVAVGACQVQANGLETETFIATAGQTAFLLSAIPQTDVMFARNGALLADAAATITAGSMTVTYVPAQNNGSAMVAGDRVDISYVSYPG